jgi:hypothetical protein
MTRIIEIYSTRFRVETVIIRGAGTTGIFDKNERKKVGSVKWRGVRYRYRKIAQVQYRKFISIINTIIRQSKMPV